MDDVFEAHAALCRVFSEPKRLRVLWCLEGGERTVGELAEVVGCTLPNVSQHLRVMRQQGLVTRRRVGRTIRYRMTNNSKFLTGCKMVREALLEELQRREPVGPGDGRRRTNLCRTVGCRTVS